AGGEGDGAAGAVGVAEDDATADGCLAAGLVEDALAGVADEEVTAVAGGKECGAAEIVDAATAGTGKGASQVDVADQASAEDTTRVVEDAIGALLIGHYQAQEPREVP